MATNAALLSGKNEQKKPPFNATFCEGVDALFSLMVSTTAGVTDTC
ncbi:hypothetical protein RI844_11585 [Thalassotalea fonticola]|uniref:Uncharacterized protein n=1 Tax=Thalassotalea fonticola TaxID=3065649 RepID=A0ABZ0GKW1_9GAMM|nr:hypothetical protein RI844_11585 [Colwelliaceae bacterium S1-1]